MTLQLYVLRQLLISFLFAIAGIAFTVFPVLAVSAMHRLAGVGIGAVVGYLPLVAMDVLPFLVPMAFLLAVVATFGRFASDNEWTAMRMAGLHPMRVLAGPLIVAVGLGVVSIWLLGDVRPRWKDVQDRYRANAVRQAFRTLSPGRTELQFGSFYLNASSREEDVFYDAVMELPREDSEPLVLLASAVRFSFQEEDLVMQLAGARSVKDDEYVAIENPNLRIPLAQIVPVKNRSRYKAKFLPSSELRAELRRGELELPDKQRFEYEIHKRNALAASFLTFLLLGAPMGLWRKSSTQLGALASAVGLAFLYHVFLLNLGKNSATSGAIAPWLAAWGANGIGLAAGLAATRRVLWR